MAMWQNAHDHAKSHPQAVLDAFYMDDGLIGADSIEEAMRLQSQLQELFDLGGFVLRMEIE